MSARDLHLFTMRYPHGTGEAYLENELPVLARRFGHITLLPLFNDVQGSRTIPSNASTVQVVAEPYASASLFSKLKLRSLIAEVTNEIRKSAPSTWVFARRWPLDVRPRLSQALQRALVLKHAFSTSMLKKDAVLYSYWAYDWPIALGLLKRMDPDIRFVTRMHGFDLYAERSPDGWPAFRDFVMRSSDEVHVPSAAAIEHLRTTATEHAHKVVLSRMGTTDHGMAPWSASDVLRIVSCSNLFPLKRVDLLVAALKHMNGSVHWTHFGDGPERARIEQFAKELPAKITVDFRGATPNAEVMNWYKGTPVDRFVHLSSSEGGVPVALQEAASFGIPLVAADAGGVHEIVDPRTGVLLERDPAPEAIAQALLGPMPSRESVRARWAEGFRAEENFNKLCDQLLGV
jgi:glycosyltransferase involved in cell wall biosynthesis